jgi:hypothetical protein
LTLSLTELSPRSRLRRRDTEIDVRFTADGAGTIVLLEHRGWERLGPDGAAIAARWANGWPRVVAAFAGRAAAG